MATTKSTSVKVTLKVTSFILRLLMNIIFYILVIILIVDVSRMAYKFTYQLYGPVTVDPAPGREIIFQVQKGDSTMDVASKLQLNRVIVNKYSFYFKTKLQALAIMPGTYKINSSMTYKQILDIITDYSASIIQADPAEGGTQDQSGTGDQTGTDQNQSTDSDTQSGQDSQTGSDQNQSGTGTDSQTQTGGDTGTNP